MYFEESEIFPLDLFKKVSELFESSNVLLYHKCRLSTESNACCDVRWWVTNCVENLTPPRGGGLSYPFLCTKVSRCKAFNFKSRRIIFCYVQRESLLSRGDEKGTKKEILRVCVWQRENGRKQKEGERGERQREEESRKKEKEIGI